MCGAAKLPRYCLKTGQPATTTWRLRCEWLSPQKHLAKHAIGKIIPLGALLVPTDSAVIEIPISDQILAQARMRRWGGVALLAVGLVVVVSVIWHQWAPATTLGVALIGLGAFVIASSHRFVRAVHIEGDCAVLFGACSEFLDRLREGDNPMPRPMLGSKRGRKTSRSRART